VTLRSLGHLCILLGACSEGTPAPRAPAGPPASGKFAVHAEVGGLAEPASGVGVRTAADVGFENTGCCGVGLYAGHTSRVGSSSRTEKARELLDGGLELTIVLPALQDRFRLRMRGGKSGTLPRTPSFGRSGFSASAGLQLRLWNIRRPAVGEGVGDFDLMVDYYGWTLGRERTTAGPRRGQEAISGGAIVFGLRLGVDYGIQLE
jgi:hypothetical protein